MTEAELAALVAEAVAAHDAQLSWGDKLLQNSETIVTLIGLGVVGVATVIRSSHNQDKRIQSLEEYRASHEAADKAAHGALESEIGHVAEEVREFRSESSEQHDKLDGKVTAMARDLNRLIGFHQSNQGDAT